MLEKKSLPEHLCKIESLDVGVTLQSLVDDLHDAGEVTCHNATYTLSASKKKTFLCKTKAKLEVSHHKLQDGKWVSSKPIVFVLDGPSPVKVKGKKKKVQVTTKNFAAGISVSKLKTCSETLRLAWRCRLLDYVLHRFNFVLIPSSSAYALNLPCIQVGLQQW